MKKFLSVIAIISIVLCLFAACSDSTTDEGASSAESQEVSSDEGVASMANPVKETDAKGIMDEFGFSFNIPDNAENIKYFSISDLIAEMQFDIIDDYYKMHFTARIQDLPEFTDITGIYTEWTDIDKGDVDGRDAEVRTAKEGDTTYQACLWYDAAPGVMYTLSTEGKNLDGFDITAVAEQTFVPTQGDVDGEE